MESNGAAAKPKSKFIREANWGEVEKKAFLLFCRAHEDILGKRSGDEKTREAKDKAWQDIAEKMSSAGYQRAKEKLKGQFLRIRLAEQKKAKHAALNAGGGRPVVATASTSTGPQQPDSSAAKLATLANLSARGDKRRMKRKHSRVLFAGHISGCRLLRLLRLYKAAEKKAHKKLIRLGKKYKRILEPITRSNNNLQMRMISELEF